MGNFKQVIEDATAATKLDPSNKNAYFYRAEAYLAQSDYVKADQDYAVVLQHDKHDGLSWYKRGYCNEKVGDLVAAKQYYGKAVKKDKKLKDAYSNRAAIWEKFGKPKKALPDLNQAINLGKNDVALRLRRGFIHLQLDNVQLASDDFVAVTQLSPESGEAFYGLGMARYQNGNVKDACEAWKQAKYLKEPRASEQLAKFCNE
jgi:tetratricopeptide (TPR) repeat protein